MQKLGLKFLISILLYFNVYSVVVAQQTVFNVPNADITPKNRIFFEHESQFSPWGPVPNWLGTHYGAYGIGHNTEIDVSLFNASAPSLNNLSLGTGFKSSIPIPKLKDKLPKNEIKLIIGSEVITSLQGKGVGNWTYTALSGRLPVTKTRLTAGVSYGSKQIFGRDATVFIGAIEQPVTEKLILAVDWYSGEEHYSGYFTAGVHYKMPKDSVLILGYQIPNGPKTGQSGFVVEISKIF